MPPNDDHRAWLQKALGVQSASTPEIKDSDIPDARGRKATDEQARQLGRQRADDMNQKPGEGPPEEDEGLLGELVDKAKEKLKEVGDEIKIPKFGKDDDKPEDPAPLVQFLKDMERDTKKAKEYVDYIEAERKRMEEIADLTGLDRIAKASDQLKKINNTLKGGLAKVSGGLGKVSKAIKKATKVAVLADAIGKFADASKVMKASDRKSVIRWVDSLEKLWDAGADFSDELKDKWWEAALEGSSMAVAATPIIVAGSELFIGIKTLKEGVKNVDAYFNRLDEIMKQIDADEKGIPKKEDPPLPKYPGDFKTEEEEEEEEKVTQKANKEMADRNNQQRKIQDATDEYETKTFPNLYFGYRPTLVTKVEADMRGRGGDTVWWDCLTDDPDVDPYDDPKLGFSFTPKKKKPYDYELQNEISAFHAVAKKGKPCPFFQPLYDGGLKKVLARVGTAKK